MQNLSGSHADVELSNLQLRHGYDHASTRFRPIAAIAVLYGRIEVDCVFRIKNKFFAANANGERSLDQIQERNAANPNAANFHGPKMGDRQNAPGADHREENDQCEIEDEENEKAGEEYILLLGVGINVVREPLGNVGRGGWVRNFLFLGGHNFLTGRTAKNHFVSQIPFSTFISLLIAFH